MMEVGNIAGAQAFILAELEKEFGGAAKAAGQTFGGQLDILKTATGQRQRGHRQCVDPGAGRSGAEVRAGAGRRGEQFANFVVERLIPGIYWTCPYWLAENIPNAI